MILSAIAALSLLRTLEHVNEPALPVLQAGPVGKEVAIVKSLQSRVGDIMWNEHAKGASTMLRWLRFKKMNVDVAEKAIKEHVKWRKDMDMDRLRVDKPKPDMWKRFWYNMTGGYARNGDPVMIMPYGDWDIRAYIDSGGDRRTFDQHQGQMWEKGLAAVEGVEANLRKQRKDPVRYIIICDLGKLEYRQLASVTSLQYILSIVNNFENNYPEVVNQALMLNCDWIFEALLRIIRPFMQGSIEKLKVQTRDRAKWERVVRRWVDPAQLPYRYGGYSKEERKKLKLPPRIDHPLEM